VGELAGQLPVSRPAVSQHLKVLMDAGLVVGRRAGNRRIYRIDMNGVGALRIYLDEFWTKALAAYKATVEQEREEFSCPKKPRLKKRPYGRRSSFKRR
jgi:DNA-binding transcriptional ArsR family regulator